MLRTLIISLLAVLALFLIVAFGSDLFAERGLQVTHWGDGSVRTRGEALRYPDGRFELDGSYQAFHADGSPHLEGVYRRGKADGLWNEWDAQGLLRKRGNYRDGQPEGRWEYWNPDGDPKHEVLEWSHGRVMVDGEPVSPKPSGPPRFFAWGRHIVGYALMLLLLIGPLPLAMLGARAPRQDSASSAPDASSVEAWIPTLIAWFLLQTGLALLLAMSGMLAAGPLFVAEAVMLVVGALLCRRQGLDLRAFAPRLEDPASAILLAGALALGLASLEKGLAVPMTDWDGLAYHLPLMAEWIQHGSLVSVPELGQTGRYPSHWELLSLLGYFAFAEDLLFTLPNLLAWALLGLSIVALGRRAGARSSDAGATALLLLSLPVVLMQTEEIKADLPLVAAFGAALVLGGFLSDSRRALRPALFLLCLGWICGLKSSGPAYAAIALLAGVAWRFALARGGFVGAASALPAAELGGSGMSASSSSSLGAVRIAAALVLAIFFAVFWYLRNYLDLGNPLGDVQVTVLGKEIFEGELQRADLQRTTILAVWRPGETADWRSLYAAGREWMGWIMLPLTLCYLASLFTGWGTRRARWVTGLLFALVALCGALYVVTPFSGDNGSHGWRLTSWVGQAWRYALPKYLAATVLASLGWRALRIPRGAAVGIAVVAAAWATALYAAPARASLVTAVVSGIVIAALLSPLRGSLGAQFSRRVMAVTAILIVLVAVAGDAAWLKQLREQRERGRQELYDLPYLYARDAANDVPVGFAMTQLRYPFYGRDLMQPVMDVSCRGCTRSSWLQTIQKRGMKVLALGPAPVRRSFARPEADLRPWVEAEGAPFRAVNRVGSGAGEGIVLYELVP